MEQSLLNGPSNNQADQKNKTPSPYTLAYVAVLLFAPLIAAHIRQNTYNLEKNAQEYIQYYIQRGYVSIIIISIGMLMGASTLIWPGNIVSQQTSMVYIGAFALILRCAGLITLEHHHQTMIIHQVYQQPRSTQGQAIPSTRTPVPLQTLLQTHLPFTTSRTRYKEKKQHPVLHKEGRLLWTIRILTAFSSFNTLLPRAVFIYIIMRIIMIYIQGYRPLAQSTIIMKSYGLEIEELQRIGEINQPHSVHEHYLTLPGRSTKRAILSGIWTILLIGYTWRSASLLVGIACIMTVWRYILIIGIRGRLPFLPWGEGYMLPLKQSLPTITPSNA